ncbi:RNA polymerase sigma factor, sigma-70 family [Xenococcus sp. PCC 7305]|uniref:sigma-70 family RNA polymerase sigma factor n=1 Tax=Xenococcus sp. PCC 7305 TaxID=102125 RepID=UPI0002ABD242|nr:sigma-70 family RNA polymerase sigma factor [Xenococcus sp. PCC 7305]ELS01311.1 RNA polymerase sigma factor, sigma-70 family [Xenococcus sp. PCC 7305]
MLISDRIASKRVQSTVLNELDLVLRSQQGDSESFRALYQLYRQKASSTLYQLCGGFMLDDLVQEVFIRAWKGLPKLRTPKYFSTWFYRICWNVATDYRRKLARNAAKSKSTWELEAIAQEGISPHIDKTSDLMRLHYQDVVKRGLEHLSLPHRVVLVLHDLEDIPQQEIAQILEVPVGTVKSRLYYARKTLKNFLQQQGISI